MPMSPDKKQPKQSKTSPASQKYTNMFAAYAAYWRRGFTEWAGTSSRSEYWWTALVNFLISVIWAIVVTSAVFGINDIAATNFVYSPVVDILSIGFLAYGIVAFIPSLSLLVRRLHDAGLSAWWTLLFILTIFPGLDIVCSIIMMIFVLLPTQKKGNPYHKFNK